MKLYNKQAPAGYNIIERFEAGIALIGSEVKAIRGSHADITGAHVKIMGSEAYLINARIFPYQFSRVESYDERRTRKLLLHKKQIIGLKSRLDQGNLTLIPTKLYNTGDLIKIEIALAKGKKQYEHRQDIKKRDLQREADEEIKEKIRLS